MIRIKIWDYCVVALFLATSGAVFWKGQLSASIAYPFLLIIAYVNAFIINREEKRYNPSLLYIYACAFLCMLNFMVNLDSLEDNSMFGFFFSMVATYLIISSYDFFYFRKILTNIVFVIVLVGMPIFALSEMSILPTSIMMDNTGYQFINFGIYTLGWYPYPFERFSGLWHEPGACQIILNTVLWMHFDSITHWKWEKGQLLKCIVILIGSLLTLSTGSYLVLMLLGVAAIFNMEIKGNHRFLIFLLLLIIVLPVIYFIFTSPVIQNKLFDADGQEMESKIIRYADMNALWQMVLDKPILGYGIGTEGFWETSYKYGNTTTSSGILAYAASLGCSWLVVYLFILWRSCRRLELGKGLPFLIVAVVIMQFNEYFIEFPISCIFLYEFLSYSKEENNIEYETDINNNSNIQCGESTATVLG